MCVFSGDVAVFSICNIQRGIGGRCGGLPPAEGVAEKPQALERGGDFPLLMLF